MAVFLDISMSLDGYVAGPNQTLDEPLGVGGEQLHDWVTRLEAGGSRTGKRAAKQGRKATCTRRVSPASGP